MEQQEYLMKLQGLEYEANQLGEQLKIIEQQKQEMGNLKDSIDNLEKSGKSEIFSELGKGIFIKSNLQEGDLLVDVGNKVFVPKSFGDVKKIVDEQVGKFEMVQGEISNRIKDINEELNNFIEKSKEDAGGAGAKGGEAKGVGSGAKGGEAEKSAGGVGAGKSAGAKGVKKTSKKVSSKKKK
jgi:prefoldin alpha subunit